MAHRVWQRIGMTLLQGLCCLGLFSGAGCVRHAAPPPVPVVVETPPAESAVPAAKSVIVCKMERETLYDEGLRAYDAGDVKRAVAAWRKVLAGETDRSVRQKALFALASVKLAQAGGDTELAAAMDLFDAWSKGSPPGGSGEDPRFLLPVLRAFKPAFAFKELKSSMDKECSRKIAERVEQARKSVQQQVRALETIHQQIQEKKKGLTNY